MNRRLSSWTVPSDDCGQSLIFALVFLTIFGFWLASMLGLATTGSLATVSVASQGTSTYEADSAVFGAIAHVRDSSSLCLSSAASTSNAFTYQAPSQPSITVSCTWVSGGSSTTAFVDFTAMSGSATVVTAEVTFYNSELSEFTPGSQPIEVDSWTDTP